MKLDIRFSGEKIKKGAAVVLIAAIFSVLALFGTSNQYTGKSDISFSIQRLPESNPASEGNEIWFQYYIKDEKREMAASLGVPDGWREYKGYLQIVPGGSTVEPLYIRCQASDIQLYLYHSPKEGKLLLENESGQQQIVDLYAEEGSYKLVSVDLPFPVHQPTGTAVFFLTSFSVFLIWGLLTVFISRQMIGVGPVLLAFYLFYYEQELFYEKSDWLVFFSLAIAGGMVCSASLRDKRMEKYRKTRAGVMILLVGMYAAFALVGHPLILQAYTVTLTGYTVCYWLLLSIYMDFLIVAALWCFEHIGLRIWRGRETACCQEKWRFWVLFGGAMASFPLWLIACFPANMPADTINIWQIINGDVEYWTGHPYCYYKTMELLVHTLKDPSLIAWVQFAFFSLITASFLHYLCKKGLSFRFAVVWAFLFTLIPSNGIGQVTLLKDYPQATALLWLTYLLVQITWDGEKAVTPKNLTALAAALLMSALYRPNGMVAFWVVAVYLWFLARKYSKRMEWLFRAVLCGVVVIFLSVNAFVSSHFKSATSTNKMLDYMILENAASVAASGKTLSDRSMQLLEKYGTWEEWAESYYPYAYNSAPSMQLRFLNDVMEEHTTADLIPLLIDSVIRAPDITLKTRLNKLNVAWGLESLPGQQWYAHLSVFKNDYGIVRGEGVMVKGLLRLMGTTVGAVAINLFFHPGLYLILVLIIGIKLCCSQSKCTLWCLFPLAGNLLSLFVSCRWQDFRYYYFVIPLSLFFLLVGMAYRDEEYERAPTDALPVDELSDNTFLRGI